MLCIEVDLLKATGYSEKYILYPVDSPEACCSSLSQRFPDFTHYPRCNADALD